MGVGWRQVDANILRRQPDVARRRCGCPRRDRSRAIGRDQEVELTQVRLPMQLGYRALAQLARGAAVVAPNSESKLLRALRGRRGIRGRYRDWGLRERD